MIRLLECDIFQTSQFNMDKLYQSDNMIMTHGIGNNLNMTYIYLCRSLLEISCSYQLSTSVLSAAIYNAESASTIWTTKFYIPLYFRVSITSVMTAGVCISPVLSEKAPCPSDALNMSARRLWTLCLWCQWLSSDITLYMLPTSLSLHTSHRRKPTGAPRTGNKVCWDNYQIWFLKLHKS